MKFLFFFSFLVFTDLTQAQLLKVNEGTNLTILNSTIFRVENLTLIPLADFTISNNFLDKFSTVIHNTGNTYISRVYRFTSNTNAFNGAVQINYNDGDELNGIPENQLTLNMHNGSAWNAYPATVRSGTNNFVLTNVTGITAINELTLANSLTPLPVIWFSFIAIKQDQTALLKWATSQEINTQNFFVEHSTNGNDWSVIGMLPAAGNSSTISNYNHIHNTPVIGVNYYRILQIDMDKRSSYSEIRRLTFAKSDEPFIIVQNPVVNNLLTVKVKSSNHLTLYTADGKFLWEEQINAGTKHVDVSRYAKGTYLLVSKSAVHKIVIQ